MIEVGPRGRLRAQQGRSEDENKDEGWTEECVHARAV